MVFSENLCSGNLRNFFPFWFPELKTVIKFFLIGTQLKLVHVTEAFLIGVVLLVVFSLWIAS